MTHAGIYLQLRAVPVKVDADHLSDGSRVTFGTAGNVSLQVIVDPATEAALLAGLLARERARSEDRTTELRSQGFGNDEAIRRAAIDAHHAEEAANGDL